MEYRAKGTVIESLTYFIFPCSGAFYSGMCDVPEEALPLHHGRSGSRQGTA